MTLNSTEQILEVHLHVLDSKCLPNSDEIRSQGAVRTGRRSFFTTVSTKSNFEFPDNVEFLSWNSHQPLPFQVEEAGRVICRIYTASDAILSAELFLSHCPRGGDDLIKTKSWMPKHVNSLTQAHMNCGRRMKVTKA